MTDQCINQQYCNLVPTAKCVPNLNTKWLTISYFKNVTDYIVAVTQKDTLQRQSKNCTTLKDKQLSIGE